MQYLTPQALTKAAPAAQRLREKSLTLLDTTAFLRHIGRDRGYLPVLAAQGTHHEDASYGPAKGRHLVVAADQRGNALILLNSHTVHRKAWMGAGFVATHGERPLFVVGAAIPVARWRGFAEPLAELDKWRPSLQEVKKSLTDWRPGLDGVSRFANAYADAAYLAKKASPAAFSDIRPRDGYDMMFLMLEKALDGNVEPADPNARRLKPIKGPDALMHAANQAFRVAANMLNLTSIPFPEFQKS